MSKAIIYAGSSTTQAVAETGTDIQFSNVVRRYGNNLSLSGGNVVATGTGYYEGDVNLTIGGTATGTVLVQIFENGNAIPYANANIPTTATSVTSVTIPFVVRNTCNCISKEISVVVGGAVANITNAGIVVEKE